MAANLAGLSTLGITLGYGVETSAGSKPNSFVALDRVNSIGGISMDTEQIDASALEDLATKYIAGRADTSGKWEVVINYTEETCEQLKDMIDAYTSLTDSKQMWFEVVIPGMSDGLFVIAQPPQVIPMPELSQNSLLTVTISLTIVEYKGQSAKVALS